MIEEEKYRYSECAVREDIVCSLVNTIKALFGLFVKVDFLVG